MSRHLELVEFSGRESASQKKLVILSLSKELSLFASALRNRELPTLGERASDPSTSSG
jgi:hypothetical protein